VPAVVELTPQAGIDVRSWRQRSDPAGLRPSCGDQPRSTGLLRHRCAAQREIDVDYPHDRLIARCSPPGCLVRPQLTQEAIAAGSTSASTGRSTPSVARPPRRAAPPGGAARLTDHAVPAAFLGREQVGVGLLDELQRVLDLAAQAGGPRSTRSPDDRISNLNSATSTSLRIFSANCIAL